MADRVVVCETASTPRIYRRSMFVLASIIGPQVEASPAAVEGQTKAPEPPSVAGFSAPPVTGMCL
jgi:hypothetical protein